MKQQIITTDLKILPERSLWDLILNRAFDFPKISSFLALMKNNLSRRTLILFLLVSCFVFVISGCNIEPEKRASLAAAENDTNTIALEPQASSTDDGGQASKLDEVPNTTGNPNASNPSVTNKPSATAKSPSPKSLPIIAAPQSLKVTLSIIGDAAHGTIVTEAVYAFEEGDTVLDLLKRVTREKQIHMEFRGRGAIAYVEGIDNLYEFDQGAESGWIYSVNGKIQNESAGSYILSSGDRVKWEYTLEVGEVPVDNGENGGQGSEGGNSE
ncbi:MAG TPA: DUF4430 domain-containing protein [Bacilli bacterium]